PPSSAVRRTGVYWASFAATGERTVLSEEKEAPLEDRVWQATTEIPNAAAHAQPVQCSIRDSRRCGGHFLLQLDAPLNHDIAWKPFYHHRGASVQGFPPGQGP